MTKDVLQKKYLKSKSSRDKYLARLLVLGRLINEFESDTERLLGPYSEHWEKLIDDCKSFKSQYAAIDSIYDGPESNSTIVLKDILSGNKQYPDDYLQKVLNLMDECSVMYKQIEKELDERIEVVKEMQRLLIAAETDS